MKNKIPVSIIEHAIDKINDLKGSNLYACDMHNEVFNMDYFIIGYYNAEQWLINNGGIFNAIDEIKQYENDNFGQVSTDFSSSEKVCNMYAYILGERLFQDIKTISDKWDSRLDDDDIDNIINELNEI